ncbi:hypothetical protein HMPREF0083_04087 [Aneurinibacillus aneurinilyticus ATCC 12856]|uniref:Uncharacterized protein n=1 Tax=Aneurinibacillus aneurinilyticus ATCC 12856 TaxID=649747 RepID=U1WYS1_ANEAE|nr:hypothetical protein HMPREF0083_04087 [Aneurinibacillus aneurinilyticus ATCC 12856]
MANKKWNETYVLWMGRGAQNPSMIVAASLSFGQGLLLLSNLLYYT